jgi:hypothetical protein
MKVVVNPVLIAVVLFLFFSITTMANGAENAEALVQKYVQYGLIPLTESPSSQERDFRLWQDAYKALVAMDRDVSGAQEWQLEQKREAFVEKKIEQYRCNELIKQFNLGHYGNRFYSIFSGTRSDGFTLWSAGQWFLLNPADARDIGPTRKHPGEMKLLMKGDRIIGEYHMEHDLTADFEGKLDNTRITFTMKMRGGVGTKKGELQIRTPLYVFGTWCEDPCGTRYARGEWDLRKRAEDR